VEELPEAITRVRPDDAEWERAGSREGLVVVKALVDVDGRVAKAMVMQSAPGLDEIALESVRQWTFKPALVHAKPIAVWVAVPIRFSRH
jgi:TonB family protein